MNQIKLDKNGQPLNLSLNKARNNSKAANSLLGILEGISCDQELNDKEIFFLKMWLDLQKDHTGDILDISECVNDILQDGIITNKERSILFGLINDCIEYSDRELGDDARMNELIGILDGIVSDDKINIDEFETLVALMTSMNDFFKKFPLDGIKKQIDNINLDGTVNEDELKQLCELIKDISGTRFTTDGCVKGSIASLFNDTIESIKGKNICLTGKFRNMTRIALEKILIDLEAFCQRKVTNETDFLIIGAMSSRDWIYNSFGRKVESALKRKKEGQNIIITNENVLMDYLS